MDIHDSFENLRRIDERIKQSEQTGEAFMNCLAERLTEHAYNWYPEWNPKRADTEKKIAILAKEIAGEILQLFGSIAYGSYEIPENKDHSIPKPKNREEAEQRLQKLKSKIPEEHHEFMAEDYWKRFEQEQYDEAFCFEAHRLINQTLTDYYSEEVMNLEAIELRQLNSFMYYLGASWYVDKYYTIMK